mmetsp:Transcript_33670/g.57773  ORF Transcript_33670/g.57773 Transcript_33670/m.57773 type:complete len:230 (+) Transcript_33670:175-864(+)
MTEHHLGTCFILRVDHSDVGGIVGDVARVGAVRQTDKAVLAPGGAPLVADLPVTTRASFHADGLHAVIHAGAAGGRAHDTRGVGAPGGGIQTHRKRAGALHVGGHVRLNHRGRGTANGGVAGDLHDEILAVHLAGAGGAGVRGVRIRSLSLLATGALEVLVRVLSPAAVAALAGLVALNHLLGGENEVSAQQAHAVGLHLLGGREAPATTAVTLILHRGGVSGGPIHKR